MSVTLAKDVFQRYCGCNIAKVLLKNALLITQLVIYDR